MKYLVYILLLFFGLNQTKAQVFLIKEPQHCIGIGFVSDDGKPIEFRYTYLKKNGPISFQLKAAKGFKNISIKYGPYEEILFGGSLTSTKRISFWVFEPGIMLHLGNKNFKRSFIAVNFPVGLGKVKTFNQFKDDPVYGNSLITQADPKTYLNYSLEFELIWSFNLMKKSFLDLGFSIGIPIKSYEVFPGSEPKYYQYVPGANVFPFVNMCVSYNFSLSK